MNRIAFFALLSLATACGSSKPAAENPDTGGGAAGDGDATAGDTAQPAGPNAAPDFTLPDIEGGAVHLADHRGKLVVLEWFNPGCPFVQYAHSEEGPLAGAAARYSVSGVVWLAINSGAPGKQGYGVEANRAAADKWSMSYPILMDVDGKVGHAYHATSTPTMVVIDKQGQVAYHGAVDNAPLGKIPETGRVNYVEKAIADLRHGRPVEIPETESYGCGVKYAD